MTTAPETAETQQPPAPDAAPDEATLLAAAQQWLSSLRAVVARGLDIAVLEARLATLNVVLILIVAIASGLLLASAWIALFAAVVAWLHGLGLSWPAALLLIAVVNFALAAAGGYAIYRMSNNLLFKAVRKFILYGERADAGAESAAGDAPPAP